MIQQDPINALKDQIAKDIAQLVQVLPEKTPKQVYADVQSLIGMDGVKQNMMTFIRRNMLDSKRKDFNMKASKGAYHTVFYGNSGTGKTTMARHRAELLHSLGLAGPKYLSLTRDNMVGQFIGHTEERVNQIIASADQIFIDEAYALSRSGSQNDFGSIIVDSLMTRLENDRDKLVVMFAGYTDEMDQFLSSNPGFKSRISYYEDLPDYTPEQLVKILETRLEADEFIIKSDAKNLAMEDMDKLKSKVGDKYFGNARVARTIAEKVPDKIADRLFPNILDEDFNCGTTAAEAFNSNSKIEELEQSGKVVKSKGGILLVKEGESIDFDRDLLPSEALELKTVTIADIQALNIRNMNVKKNEQRAIGFGA